MPTLNWTGERMPNAGLLYLSYTNRADVMHYGTRVGDVFALPDGYYLPKIDGIQGEKCATPDQAARVVVELHTEYGSR